MKLRVLFVCIHNSARSQMAEAFLNRLGSNGFEAKSAGIEPGILNPNVIEVMKEIGIDLAGKETKGVFDLLKQKLSFDIVITVCDRQAAERCPFFPGEAKRLSWSFPDPSAFKGSREEVLEQTRKVRNDIEKQVADFIKEAAGLNSRISVQVPGIDIT